MIGGRCGTASCVGGDYVSFDSGWLGCSINSNVR